MGPYMLTHIFSCLSEWIPSVNRTLTFLTLQLFFFFSFLYCLSCFVFGSRSCQTCKLSPTGDTMIEDLAFWSDHLVISVRWMIEIYSPLGERWLIMYFISPFVCLLISSNYLEKWFMPTEKKNTYVIAGPASFYLSVFTFDPWLRWLGCSYKLSLWLCITVCNCKKVLTSTPRGY